MIKWRLPFSELYIIFIESAEWTAPRNLFVEVIPMREPETCSVCGEPYPLDQLTEFDGQLLCSSCLGIETMVWDRKSVV